MKSIKSNVMKSAISLMVAGSLFASGLTVAVAESMHDAASKKPLAKNVIVMISDGMGYNHVAAADYYQYGATGTQVYEKFPFEVAMATYSLNEDTATDDLLGVYDPVRAWSEFDYVKSFYTDSAAAATAMSTGVKTINRCIGLDDKENRLTHIAERAEELGKATGVITTVEWSHATPAGFVAHNANRNSYAQIAQEMVGSSTTDVIMGAGHPWFDNNGKPKATPNTFQYVGGEATWNGLVAGTLGADADGDGASDPWKLVQKREEFQKLMEGETPKRVLGTLESYTTAQQARSARTIASKYEAPYDVPRNQNVPTLAEMTKGALNVLDNDKDGFFLMVEGGAVDWASHANEPGRVIEEQIDFNESVEAVCDWVKKNSNWAETLVIVTGDHETGYITGPNSGTINGNPIWNILANNGVGMLPGMEWHSGQHTNSLIPLYAKGDAARLLKTRYADQYDLMRGAYIDNTEIAELAFEVME